MRRKREQDAQDQPIRRKKRSERSRSRVRECARARAHKRGRERDENNFAVTRLGSLNRVLNGECIKKSLCAGRPWHPRTSL